MPFCACCSVCCLKVLSERVLSVVVVFRLSIGYSCFLVGGLLSTELGLALLLVICRMLFGFALFLVVWIAAVGCALCWL